MLDLCPCLVDVEVLDQKSNESILVSAGVDACGCHKVLPLSAAEPPVLLAALQTLSKLFQVGLAQKLLPGLMPETYEESQFRPECRLECSSSTCQLWSMPCIGHSWGAAAILNGLKMLKSAPELELCSIQCLPVLSFKVPYSRRVGLCRLFVPLTLHQHRWLQLTKGGFVAPSFCFRAAPPMSFCLCIGGIKSNGLERKWDLPA